MNNKFYTVCGLTEIDHKILFVRHTYGMAKDRILLPGGYVQEQEMPTDAVAREIWEETGVKARAKTLMAMQFKPEQWCAVYQMEYLSGTPKSDGYENSEVLLLTCEEALQRSDITNMSREIIKAYVDKKPMLEKSNYVPVTSKAEEYAIFGV